MQPIEKYSVKTAKYNDGRINYIEIFPSVNVNFNIYPDGKVMGATAENIAEALNYAYTQAVIDIMNEEIKKPLTFISPVLL
ncbi:unnamed protein product [marine sediment metagenome]|uniref:Uncharacterized protein n=1 Tax=marine sediment metagenome TaxID=412755 RepID=X1KTK8_9ZZZZ